MKIKKNFLKLFCLYIVSFLLFFLLTKNESNAIINPPSSFSGYELLYFFLIILIRNSLTCLLLILATYLRKKYIIYFFIIANSYILALLISKLNYFNELILIFPHGVFEVTGFLLFASLSLSIIGTNSTIYSNKRDYYKYYFIIFISIIIESFITPLISLVILQ